MSKYIITVLFMILIAFSSCTTFPVFEYTPALRMPVATRIDTAVVTRGPLVDVRRYIGMVRRGSSAMNFGRLSGAFGVFYVNPGDEVRQGDLLAVMDTTGIDEQIANQERLIANMEIDHHIDLLLLKNRLDMLIAEKAHLTGQMLINKDMDVINTRLDIELMMERQDMAIQQQRADLAYLQNRRAEFHLYAPFDGLITNVVHRNWVPSFTDVIFISPHDADVFIENIGAVIRNISLHASIEGHIRGHVFELSRLALTRDQQLYYRNLNINLPVRFSASEFLTTADVGSFAEIYIYNHYIPSTLLLPINALFSDPDMGSFVYVVQDGILHQQIIETGIITNIFAEILYGLEEGAVVYVR